MDEFKGFLQKEPESQKLHRQDDFFLQKERENKAFLQQFHQAGQKERPQNLDSQLKQLQQIQQQNKEKIDILQRRKESQKKTDPFRIQKEEIDEIYNLPDFKSKHQQEVDEDFLEEEFGELDSQTNLKNLEIERAKKFTSFHYNAQPENQALALQSGEKSETRRQDVSNSTNEPQNKSTPPNERAQHQQIELDLWDNCSAQQNPNEQQMQAKPLLNPKNQQMMDIFQSQLKEKTHNRHKELILHDFNRELRTSLEERPASPTAQYQKESQPS